MSAVVTSNIFTDASAIAGAAIDTNFSNISTVVNGNLRAENFTARAGIGLQNRAMKGNLFTVSGGTTAYTQAAGSSGVPVTNVPILLDMSAEDLIGDIPAVFSITEIGANIEAIAGYAEPTGDEIDLQYRLFNARTNAWSAWATQIDSAVVWAASTPQVSVAAGAINAVIGEKDYERIQLSFAVAAAAGANIVLQNISVWITFEALHVP